MKLQFNQFNAWQARSTDSTGSPQASSGQAALATVLAGMFIAFSISIGISAIAFLNIQRLQNNTQRIQSYYAAEGGMEDALLRVIDADLTHQTGVSQTLTVGSSTASTTIVQSGNTLTIQSDGKRNTSVRKLLATLITAGGASFDYAVQAGNGGVTLNNNSRIEGDLYSNSSVVGDDINVTITGDVWVVGVNTLRKVTTGGNAHAHTIDGSIIGGNAYYQIITGSTVSGSLNPGSVDLEPKNLPISQSQIDAWKNEAAGGTIGNYSLTGNNSGSLGPKKVSGTLLVQNTAILTLNGTVWVTGDVTLKNNGAIELASSYGNNSGVLITDGKVIIDNGFTMCGSEGFNSGTNKCNAGGESYVFVISTNSSVETGNPAILMKGTSSNLNGVLYTSNGLLSIEGSAKLKEATGYQLNLKNNAVIIYETGLANPEFQGGPAGGWDIQSWKEVN